MKIPQGMKEVRLLIGVPTRGTYQANFGLSLSFLINLISANPIVKIDGTPHVILWYVENKNSSILCGNRQKLLDQALSNDCTHMLFVDDDMVFDATMVYDWLIENRPVIAANCPTRGIPTYPTARDANGARGDLVYTPEDLGTTPRWKRVWRVGTGIMMLRADAMRSLPRPAFTPRWSEELDDYVGEDWVMCEHLEAAGIPIIIDQLKSRSVGHIGTLTFTHDMVDGQRQLEKSTILTPTMELGPVLTEIRHNGGNRQ